MEKNTDGYYKLYIAGFEEENSDIHYLQVDKGKIVDCVYEVDEYEGAFRETYSHEKEAFKNVDDYKKNMLKEYEKEHENRDSNRTRRSAEYMQYRIQKAFDARKNKFEENENIYFEKNQRAEYMQAALGEDIRDFLLDKMLNGNGWSLRRMSSSEYINEKGRVMNYLGISEEEHNHHVADILRAKENKNTLGKTDVLGKIASMKGRTGGK